MKAKEDKAPVQVEENSSPGFFGAPLDNEAPIPVCDCMEFLRGNGITMVGIFRVAGRTSRIKRMKQLYNDEFTGAYEKEENQMSVLNCLSPTPHPYDVASLLKSFFLDLPEPIIPVDLKFQLLQAVDPNIPDEQQLMNIGTCIQLMPQINRNCLSLLVSFLKEITLNRKANQMNASNLGMCFALCLFHGGNAHEQMILATKGGRVLELLIERKVPLYMPTVDSVRNNTKYKILVPGDDTDIVSQVILLDIDDDKAEASAEGNNKRRMFKPRSKQKLIENHNRSNSEIKKSSFLAMFKSTKSQRSTNISRSKEDTDYEPTKFLNSPKMRKDSRGWFSRNTKVNNSAKQKSFRRQPFSSCADEGANKRRQTYEMVLPDNQRSIVRSEVSKQMSMLEDDCEFLSPSRLQKLESTPTLLGRKQQKVTMISSTPPPVMPRKNPVKTHNRQNRNWSFLSDFEDDERSKGEND